jgi:hypothetical protein
MPIGELGVSDWPDPMFAANFCKNMIPIRFTHFSYSLKTRRLLHTGGLVSG